MTHPTPVRTTFLALALVATLAGCNAGRDGAANASADDATAIEKNVESSVQSAMDEARQELATENLSLDGPGAAKAEITPKGDLLIDRKPIPVTAEQRALLLDYRAQIAGVASAGMDVGMQGAQLAAKAVGEALRGVFSGNPDEIGKRVEAQAEPIRQAALKLCDRLPALYQAQEKLSAALPEFEPYAKMDPDDIDDCRKDAVDAKPMAPAAPSAPAAPAAPAGEVAADL
jgi:hypothetical protein